MPAPHLVFNEWDKHGTCSGLAPRAYFEAVRKARAVVKIPPQYVDLQEPLSVSPAAVEDAFQSVNPGLARDGMAIVCDKRRLTEVRICLSKDLQFHQCPDVARRSCRREQLAMPPLRGAAGGGVRQLNAARGLARRRTAACVLKSGSVRSFRGRARLPDVTRGMNYRHAFHAGNFADVHKHAVLARILMQLRRKPAAFRVIDTHAGAGL